MELAKLCFLEYNLSVTQAELNLFDKASMFEYQIGELSTICSKNFTILQSTMFIVEYYSILLYEKPLV